MTITLQLDEDLAERLKEQAEASDISLESCATEVLDSALEASSELESWGQVNARRYELIRKSRDVDLTPQEVDELNLLQSRLTALLEPADRKMLDQLSELERKLGIHDD